MIQLMDEMLHHAAMVCLQVKFSFSLIEECRNRRTPMGNC